MKNALIQLPADKVTISEQGKKASERLRAGDTPFVRFLDEADSAGPSATESMDTKTVDPVNPIYDSENAFYAVGKPEVSIQRINHDDSMMFDVGSRLEFEAPVNMKSVVIRSTTRVNLTDGSNWCETNWEVFPDE